MCTIDVLLVDESGHQLIAQWTPQQASHDLELLEWKKENTRCVVRDGIEFSIDAVIDKITHQLGMNVFEDGEGVLSCHFSVKPIDLIMLKPKTGDWWVEFSFSFEE